MISWAGKERARLTAKADDDENRVATVADAIASLRQDADGAGRAGRAGREDTARPACPERREARVHAGRTRDGEGLERLALAPARDDDARRREPASERSEGRAQRACRRALARSAADGGQGDRGRLEGFAERSDREAGALERRRRDDASSRRPTTSTPIWARSCSCSPARARGSGRPRRSRSRTFSPRRAA